LNKYLLENSETILKPFIKLLLEHREYNKLISSFGNKFLEFINPVTGFIHSDYFQNNTATGRLSCSKPNIQQIPGIKEIR
ncbi:DNA polymerase, partial [Loigolactobacillus coryniformis]|uniref:DNA polymerase n=1 Tax=Loigolactobacillus coryniformis TaxID=1610 RepID=UPI00201A25F1